MTKNQHIDVTPDDFGTRVDVLVARALPELSRGFIKKLAKDGLIQFEAQVVDVGYKPKRAGSIIVEYDMAALKQIPVLDLPIIFEDDQMIVINKPSGVITHSRGRYWDEPSVASSIRTGLEITDDSTRAGIVHRLDRATSGVLVCAKTDSSAKILQSQFSDRTVQKVYRALVDHSDLPDEGIINKPIARNPKKPATFRVHTNGKTAETRFKVLKRLKTTDLLELYPVTGRTHQLRVHLQSMGRPIVGDFLYGGRESDRLMLHAYLLTIDHPVSGESMTFTAEPPKGLEA